MAKKKQSKSATSGNGKVQKDTYIDNYEIHQGYPSGLRCIDEVVPFCVELIGKNQNDNNLVNKFQNTKNDENFSKGP